MATIDLLYNLAILVAICVVSGFIDTRYSKETWAGYILQGFLFGFAAAIGMIFPYSVIGEAIFDARTVVISVVTLFFGPVAGLITVAISILARVYVGGEAMIPGIVVISSSFLIGYVFYTLHKSSTTYNYSIGLLYSMGISVHIVMLILLAILLPDYAREPFLRQFGITVIVFYPLATILIGKVLNDHFLGKKLINDLQNSKAQLNTSLKEKKILLAEIHHRVKNNLAIVSSLISLQSDLIRDQEAKNLLTETEGRIRSMSLIHELVYKNDSYEVVEIDSYLKAFQSILADMYSDKQHAINITNEAYNIYLNLNKAIPCALILNELLTNAYKHAFNGVERGEIIVRFTEKRENYVLTVSDNGVGLPDDFNPADATSFGFTIVYGLTQQLNGKVKFSNADDTTFTVIFPKAD
ncbi:MAG: ATP-binding protein [Bacteroidetes bacterium]|nr:ATP-binding protein [Bacteroidota bacterium]MCH8525358.1 ATP-binding protein [Balneolales bacterium]